MQKTTLRKMTPAQWMIIALAATGAVGCTTLTPRAAAQSQRLTPATYDAIKAKVIPRPQDFAWQQVHWRDGFFDGLLAAQAADKPLFYWLYEGDPRSGC
ncbi:MAG: hypothetical protein ACO1SX_14740 [Actinomycetota bacterium]